MEEKIGFFKQIKKSICNFEYYINFVNEKASKAWKYFLKLILIFTIITTAVITYQAYKVTTRAIAIVDEEFPDFTITSEGLTLENNEPFIYTNEKESIAITMDSSKEELEEPIYNDSINFLKDKIYLTFSGENRTIPYSQLFEKYDEKSINKGIVIDTFSKDNIVKIYIALIILMFVTIFVAYFIYFLMDVLILAIIGLILNYIIKTKLKFSNILKIAMHAITLPIILMQIYIIINILFGITIKYFSVAYDAISYIYMITVLLILKSDIIKNEQIVGAEVVKKEKEEKEEKEEDQKQEETGDKEKNHQKDNKENKENKEEKGKDKKEPGEPEGSNA